jgi:hypothetical protein
VVVVGAVLVAGLALGDRDEGTGAPKEERDNRDRAELKTTTTVDRSGPTTTRSTTTTSIPLGPVFGEPVGVSLVVLSANGVTGTIVDLDTGARAEVRISSNDPYGSIPVRGGLVVVQQGSAEYLPLEPPSLATVVTDAEAAGPVEAREAAEAAAAAAAEEARSTLGAIRLGDADRVIASGSPDSVWLIREFYEDPSQPGARAQLVDLAGRSLTEVVYVPVGYPMAATDEGIVFTVGGRVYLAGEGGVQPLMVGEVLDAAAGRIAVLTCDDEAVCTPEVRDMATGRSTRFESIHDPYQFGIGVTLSSAGALAVLWYQGETYRLYDSNGQELGSIDGISSQGEPAWLPGDLGVLVAGPAGLRWVARTRDGLVSQEPPALDGLYGDIIYVIPR